MTTTGIIMAFIMLGVGALYTFRLGFFQFTHFFRSISTAFEGLTRTKASKSRKLDNGGITPFQAMATALGGSIGTANIAGVAGAIITGGPGAIFWMWVAALLGMATKLAEIALAIRYRERIASNGGSAENGWHGGAMLYIEKGMGRKFRPLAVSFALFGSLAALVGTALIQSNTIALSAYDMMESFGYGNKQMVIRLICGIITATLTGIVILGGAKRIGRFSERIVPFMAIVYTLAALAVIIVNFNAIDDAFISIFRSAFGLRAATGGAIGFTMRQAMITGVARGVYSNEAGVGSAPMAHAGATTTDPVKQGMMGIFEVFADTIIMCTLTALVILTSGIEIPWANANYSGTTLALSAFGTLFPHDISAIFLAIAMLLFAFTSLVGWSLYGVRCTQYLFGVKAAIPFRIAFLILIPAGAVMSVNLVWTAGESLNYLMALPNLIALVFLSGNVARLVKEYKMFDKKK